MKLRRCSPFALPWLAAAFLALAAADCESLKAPPPDSVPLEDDDPLGYTEPAALVEAFAAAHEALDLEAYTALLHESFEFIPHPSDAADFPWMTGDSWDRAQELSIASHLRLVLRHALGVPPRDRRRVPPGARDPRG